MNETATGLVLSEKVSLEILQYSQENSCARVSFLIKLQEIYKSTFFTEHFPVTVSGEPKP